MANGERRAYPESMIPPKPPPAKPIRPHWDLEDEAAGATREIESDELFTRLGLRPGSSLSDPLELDERSPSSAPVPPTMPPPMPEQEYIEHMMRQAPTSKARLAAVVEEPAQPFGSLTPWPASMPPDVDPDSVSILLYEVDPQVSAAVRHRPLPDVNDVDHLGRARSSGFGEVEDDIGAPGFDRGAARATGFGEVEDGIEDDNTDAFGEMADPGRPGSGMDDDDTDSFGEMDDPGRPGSGFGEVDLDDLVPELLHVAPARHAPTPPPRFAMDELDELLIDEVKRVVRGEPQRAERPSLPSLPEEPPESDSDLGLDIFDAPTFVREPPAPAARRELPLPIPSFEPQYERSNEPPPERRESTYPPPSESPSSEMLLGSLMEMPLSKSEQFLAALTEIPAPRSELATTPPSIAPTSLVPPSEPAFGPSSFSPSSELPVPSNEPVTLQMGRGDAASAESAQAPAPWPMIIEPVRETRSPSVMIAELDLEGDEAPVRVALRSMTPLGQLKPENPMQRRLERVRARFEVGDYSGALVIAEGMLDEDPKHLAAKCYADSCRAMLRQMYLARIGDKAGVLRVTLDPDEIRELALDHRAGFLLSCIDGASTIDEILDVSGMQPLDALRILYELIQEGVIEAEGPPSRRP